MDAQAMAIKKQHQWAGRLGGRKRSERKTQANRVNGKRGGLAHTERKALAARANGKLGGRLSKAAKASAESQVMNEIFGSELAQP